jgi:signal transduction histidine kinase
VLTNLVTNAIRYSPKEGPIEIGVQPSPEWVQLTVSDRGDGVPREQQQRIFERFARLRPEDGAGVGLGLAIAKAIVDQHGGKIWVESSGVPGEGSTFYVRLPRERKA